jgi:predicted Zn-ribbon and HTH transcriptional regulator
MLSMIELQDIFKQHVLEYIKTHRLPVKHLKVISAIECCRTAKLGGHVDECDDCGYTRISYNSCRDRHCPKCQSLAKEKWLIDQKEKLLPTQYFHVVFTIPDSLNDLALTNPKVIYSILFKASSETLLEMTKSKRHLGAQIGFTSILHTWGQNLMLHPHNHIIVPAGGLSFDGTKWVNSKRKKYLLPVKAMSKKFRGKFIELLERAYSNNELTLCAGAEYLKFPNIFKSLVNELYTKNWVVYCKPPFKNAESVLEYIGRYSHRVAIANSRIVSLQDGKVTFKWRDYKDNNKQKLMTLDAHEFIRRFLLHVLPDKFVKIRHYGILSNKNCHTKLLLCQTLAGTVTQQESRVNDMNTAQLILLLFNTDITLCPCCGEGRMIRKQELKALNLSPPSDALIA